MQYLPIYSITQTTCPITIYELPPLDLHKIKTKGLFHLKEKAKGGKLLNRAAERFDLPGEVLSNLPRVTIVGCGRVVVENHKGLLDYSENAIIVNGGRVTVHILGDKLELRAMNALELLVTGTVFNIEFTY